MFVSKFGGSSLADANQIKKVFGIVSSDRNRKVIVVSAPGKRYKSDRKVTDLLIQCARTQMNGEDISAVFSDLLDRYNSIIKELALSDDICRIIEADIKERIAQSTVLRSEEFLDLMKAAGEDNCAKLVAAFFTKSGLPARYINPKDVGFYLSDHFGNAQVLPETYINLTQLKSVEEIIVFPGFFGYTKKGKVITFSRGGSDITGSILAAAFDAELYENFTDVNNVFAVDPSLVPNAKAIKELTYREMRELSYAGFNVYHEDALIPVFNKGIPVKIKNTNNPTTEGTTILPTREFSSDEPVVGISVAKEFMAINVSKLLMNTEVGFGRKLLSIIEEESIPFEHMPSGIDNISIVINEHDAPPEVERRIVNQIQDKLHSDEISIRHDLAIVMLVGEGMLNTVGIAAKATRALSDAGINIELINQGASEVSLMFGVDVEYATKAVRSLYSAFFQH